jgi:hypothetical protein
LLICFFRFLIFVPVITVRSPDEVGSVDSNSVQPFGLNHFFGEDGKIYNYKNLKVNYQFKLAR